MPESPVHDVVIIGSGAGGGTVTKVLADLGVPRAAHGSRARWSTHGRLQDDAGARYDAVASRRRRAAALYTTGQGARS